MYEVTVSDRRSASGKMVTKTRLVCQMDNAITVSPKFIVTRDKQISSQAST